MEDILQNIPAFIFRQMKTQSGKRTLPQLGTNLCTIHYDPGWYSIQPGADNSPWYHRNNPRPPNRDWYHGIKLQRLQNQANPRTCHIQLKDSRPRATCQLAPRIHYLLLV